LQLTALQSAFDGVQQKVGNFGWQDL